MQKFLSGFLKKKECRTLERKGVAELPPPARQEEIAVRKKTIKKVLAIDSGGIKSLTAIIYLQKIEKKLHGTSLNEYFDLFAGSGTGALIALMLSCGMDADSIYRFSLSKFECFLKERHKGFFDSKKNKYDSETLRETLDELFKKAKTSDVPKPFLLTAFDLKSMKPVTITNKDDIPLCEAALSSMANPLFYESRMVGEMELTSGFVHNPSADAYCYAAKIFPGFDEMKLISLSSFCQKVKPTDENIAEIQQKHETDEILGAIPKLEYIRIKNEEKDCDLINTDSSGESKQQLRQRQQQHDLQYLIETGENVRFPQSLTDLLETPCQKE